MTRTPAVTKRARVVERHPRSRARNRKTVESIGAGLALAGAGAATLATGFTASAAAATTPNYSVQRAIAAGTTRQHLRARAHKAAPDQAMIRAAVGAAARRASHAAVKVAKAAAAAARATDLGGSSPRHVADLVRLTAASRAGGAARTGHSARTARAVHPQTWSAIARIVADRTNLRAGNGLLPAADRLTPVGTSGPQAWLPMTAARWRNAAAIVRQDLAKRMGLRSAVIAVATSMQESTLENLGYGTLDSLGLFQQRPSMGWGTAQQVMNPAYSADAFYAALRAYQAGDPGWAQQPLWQTAQGVQKSAFPYAYAKWENQAAQVVKAVTKHMV